MTQDDIFFVASILEAAARETDNRIGDIARQIGRNNIRTMMELADVSHCLPMVQIVAETITDNHIQRGHYAPFDFANDKQLPRPRAIGKVYARLVADLEDDPKQYPDRLYDVLTSVFSEWISDDSSAAYYASRDEVLYDYITGAMKNFKPHKEGAISSKRTEKTSNSSNCKKDVPLWAPFFCAFFFLSVNGFAFFSSSQAITD